LRTRQHRSSSQDKYPLDRMLWARHRLALTQEKSYDRCYAQGSEQAKMRQIKRQLTWILVTLSLLTGCQPLEDLGKLVDDLLKRFTG